jgi:hypothetical protein
MKIHCKRGPSRAATADSTFPGAEFSQDIATRHPRRRLVDQIVDRPEVGIREMGVATSGLGKK